jgi:hypothetical protein
MTANIIEQTVMSCFIFLLLFFYLFLRLHSHVFLSLLLDDHVIFGEPPFVSGSDTRQYKINEIPYSTHL